MFEVLDSKPRTKVVTLTGKQIAKLVRKQEKQTYQVNC